MFGIGRATLMAFVGASSIRSNGVRRSFMASTPLKAKQYILTYEYVEDVLEKRGPYREGHLNLAQKLIDENRCSYGGPTADLGSDIPTGALFVFSDAEAAELFVKEDPYVSNGIVTSSNIQEWNVVVQKE